jgi:hypothetical protein
MRCTHCGADNDRNFTVCGACGRTRVIAPAAARRGSRAPAGGRPTVPDLIVPPTLGGPGRVGPRVPPQPVSPAAPGSAAPVTAGPESPVPAGPASSVPGVLRDTTTRSSVILSGVFLLAGAIITAAATLVPPMLKEDKPPEPKVTVVIQRGLEQEPAPQPPAGDTVDDCLVGEWSAVDYSRLFLVDRESVTLRLVSGGGFTLRLDRDGTGRTSLSTQPRLAGSSSRYVVNLVEAGESTFTFTGQDNVLVYDDVRESYDFEVAVNGVVVPKDQLDYTEIYRVSYMCSGSRLVLTTEFYRIEYRRR